MHTVRPTRAQKEGGPRNRRQEMVCGGRESESGLEFWYMTAERDSCRDGQQGQVPGAECVEEKICKPWAGPAV